MTLCARPQACGALIGAYLALLYKGKRVCTRRACQTEHRTHSLSLSLSLRLSSGVSLAAGTMESCGVSGADAKILQLEGVMQGVAGEWVEEQSKVFDERVARREPPPAPRTTHARATHCRGMKPVSPRARAQDVCLRLETWAPLDDSNRVGGSSIDIVKMMMQAPHPPPALSGPDLGLTGFALGLHTIILGGKRARTSDMVLCIRAKCPDVSFRLDARMLTRLLPHRSADHVHKPSEPARGAFASLVFI